MKTTQQRGEGLARKLHEWYLEACQKPESGMDFNPAAQKPYEKLKETQKFLDRYIAKKVIVYIQQARDEGWEEGRKSVQGTYEANRKDWEEKAREEATGEMLEKIEYLVNSAEGENKMISPKLLRDLFLIPAK